jgi:hypothetical protein
MLTVMHLCRGRATDITSVRIGETLTSCIVQDGDHREEIVKVTHSVVTVCIERLHHPQFIRIMDSSFSRLLSKRSNTVVLLLYSLMLQSRPRRDPD